MKPPVKNHVAPNAAALQSQFQQGLALHQQGLLLQAQALFEQVLQQQPQHFDTLHLLGVIAYQTGNPEHAVDLFSRAIETDPNRPAAHVNLGNALQETNRIEAALQSYDRAIALKPDHADAYYNRGNGLAALNQLQAALASYDRAITFKPDHADAHYNRGHTLQELKQLEAALASFDRAIAFRPDFAEAYSNRGLVLHELKRWDAALASFDRAIALTPDIAEAHYLRGRTLAAQERPDAAIASFERALALKPDYTEACHDCGLALAALRQWDGALARYARALQIKPDYAEAHNNSGVVLQALGQFDHALEHYTRALHIKPDYADAHCNRGVSLQELKRFDEARACYNRTLQIQPDHVDAHWNLAVCCLLTGDFARGWQEYEWRWQNRALPTFREQRRFPQPLWQGSESLAGKTILLHCEQGLGDTLQFCRYAKRVSDLGARVILEVQAPLLPLLQRLDGVAQWIAAGSTLPPFDFHCPLLSLPLVFKTDLDTIPASNGYITSDPGKVAAWQARLGSKTRPRIGLTWSGNIKFAGDDRRSIALAEFVKLLPEGDFEFVCLQKEIRERDQQTLQSRPDILFLGNTLNDFSDTAALCDCMDLVISTCTSVAHLAGALGKPTWLLLSAIADWRWQLDRTDSPWYPTAKLYRQKILGDWDNVFRQVSADLISYRMRYAA